MLHILVGFLRETNHYIFKRFIPYIILHVPGIEDIRHPRRNIFKKVLKNLFKTIVYIQTSADVYQCFNYLLLSGKSPKYEEVPHYPGTFERHTGISGFKVVR